MRDITVIGIDIAKNVIQIHGMDSKGKCVLTKRLPRDKFLNYMVQLPSCLVGLEACGGSHYWATELLKLGFDVKLMSPRKVKKYADHNKNDANDAAACAEAVTRGSMEFVPIKTQEQMDMQSLHRVRSFYVKNRTAIMNMIRGLLLEMGIAINKTQSALYKKLSSLIDSEELNENNKILFTDLFESLKQMDKEVERYTQKIEKLAAENEACKRIRTILGIGPLTATAVIAKIGNGSDFKKGRELSAYLGLVPKQHSSGEKNRLLGINKNGDQYIRTLLVHGGRSCIQAVLRKSTETKAYTKNDPHSQWIRALVERIGMNKASVAVANKNARMIVALLKNKTTFEPMLAH
jgi:transposase